MTKVEAYIRAPHHYRPSDARVPSGAALWLERHAPGVGGEVFLIHRTGAHGEGTWSVPGGWVDKGEDPEKAAAREAWEEVGVRVESALFVGYTHDRHPEGFDGVTLWFKAEKWSGTARNTNPDRINAVTWWPVEGLLDGAVPGPLFEPLIRALQKRLVP